MSNVNGHPMSIGNAQQYWAAISKHPRPWHLSAKRDSIEDTRGHTILATDMYPTDPALLEAICVAINQLYPSR